MRREYLFNPVDPWHEICRSCGRIKNTASACHSCGWSRPVHRNPKRRVSAGGVRVAPLVEHRCPGCGVVPSYDQPCQDCVMREFEEARAFPLAMRRGILEGGIVGGTAFGILFQLLQVSVSLSLICGVGLAMVAFLRVALTSRKFVAMFRQDGIRRLGIGVAVTLVLYAAVFFVLAYIFRLPIITAKILALLVIPLVCLTSELQPDELSRE